MTETVVEKVTFDAHGVTLAGHLHLPATADRALPAVVVAGAWTTVKEQMAGLYARRLAERGFAALAFDFTGYGESDGEPRDVESPSLKVRDLGHAVTFLSGLDRVSPARIGALGICAGGAFAAAAAANDNRIASLALVAPGLQDGELMRLALGGEEAFAARLAEGQRARAHYEETGQVEYVPGVSETDSTAAMFGPYAYYLDPARGAVPQWGNRWATMAWAEWLTFEPQPSADRITAPVLIVHSESAGIPVGARRFADRLTGARELVWLEERSQFDFYDTEPTVTDSVDNVARHLHATL
ncbi:alpha/beta hydrolase [Nonomuraea sp. NPDC049784]|uniref:alpha/beta hydrolase n=1 Tax=Nonomuraea sp. NPDC049784 TaxID=3154361 RepID=UPI0033DDE139